MDYALMQDPSAALGNWQVVALVLGYDGIEFLPPGSPPSPKTHHHHHHHRVVGLGARVARFRDVVRRYTAGAWIGPRMAPRVYIMRRVTRKPRYATA
ncbi:hypothetical protein CDD80_6018 [Ophiocordyceps camponoti-rufipedis]|uniref:Uncharacterized protein n=1 Tax=Ophiocordyceps camponoti-rufipedis TaxID=2004952 RepID=A0A2C5YU35_9HYPO|nr:hypothetical protein CDD80_6018 [Ophiocordyceps camponoti-rufipedis]